MLSCGEVCGFSRRWSLVQVGEFSRQVSLYPIVLASPLEILMWHLVWIATNSVTTVVVPASCWLHAGLISCV